MMNDPWVEAKLVKLRSEDGIWYMREGVKVGEVYRVAPATVLEGHNVHLPTGQKSLLFLVMLDNGQWVPTELLEWEGKGWDMRAVAARYN